jgi:predicted nucleic acid-binding protein
MSVLLDTNILTRSAQPAHPMHQDAVVAVSALRTNGEDLYVVPQNLIEFWAVATRPLSANGLEMTTERAQAELARIKSLFRLLQDTPAVYDEWEILVAQYAVSGKNTYDARIVAAMTVHGISDLLTFNVADFKRYPGITVTSPSQVK